MNNKDDTPKGEKEYCDLVEKTSEKPNQNEVHEYKPKVCECGSGLIPGFGPSKKTTSLDKSGNSYVFNAIPVWFCSACGYNSAVLKEDSGNWSVASFNFFSRLVRAINVSERMMNICPDLKELLENEEEACSAHDEGNVH